MLGAAHGVDQGISLAWLVHCHIDHIGAEPATAESGTAQDPFALNPDRGLTG